MQILILQGQIAFYWILFSHCHKMYFDLSMFFHGLQAVTVLFYVILSGKQANGRDKMTARLLPQTLQTADHTHCVDPAD